MKVKVRIRSKLFELKSVTPPKPLKEYQQFLHELCIRVCTFTISGNDLDWMKVKVRIKVKAV